MYGVSLFNQKIFISIYQYTHITQFVKNTIQISLLIGWFTFTGALEFLYPVSLIFKISLWYGIVNVKTALFLSLGVYQNQYLTPTSKSLGDRPLYVVVPGQKYLAVLDLQCSGVNVRGTCALKYSYGQLATKGDMGHLAIFTVMKES